MTKRILTWLCVLALTVLLTACTPNGSAGSGTERAGDTATTAAPNTTTSPQETQPESSGGDIELPRVEF